MGLFDKVKNLFTEPEYTEEIRVEQIKKEVPKKENLEQRKIVEHKRERNFEFDDDDDEEEVVVNNTSEIEPVEKTVEPEEKLQMTREKLKTPVFFTENDFADLEPQKPKRVEKKKESEVRNIPKKEDKKQPYSGGYTSTTILTKEKPTFKPTPIISPIYGILDKNYTKEDIVEKNDIKQSKTGDLMKSDRFDEVRKKAYGRVRVDIEDELEKEDEKVTSKVTSPISNEVDLFDELELDTKTPKKKEIDISDTTELAKTVNEQEKNIKELEEVTMDLTKELDNLLLQRETYNQKKEKIEHNLDEDLLTENELYNFIDSIYEEGKE